MIGRNHLVEIKRIEKLSLSIFPPPHHAPLPLMPSPPTESRFASRLNESFATQSPSQRTSSGWPGSPFRAQKQTVLLAQRDRRIDAISLCDATEGVAVSLINPMGRSATPH